MKKKYLFLLLLYIGSSLISAQELDRNVEQRLTNFFKNYTTNSAKIAKCNLENFATNHEDRILLIYTGENFAGQPFTPEIVNDIYNQLRQTLPGPVNYYDIVIFANGKPIEDLIPNAYRGKDKDRSRLSHVDYKGAPWVKNISFPYEITKGLQNRHISLWQSHGHYFDNKRGKWRWQRPPLFCTTEDMFTQSFVTPYLIPMLENAGAIVFTPRERDTQRNEVIVDNDVSRTPSLYVEANSKKGKWVTYDHIQGFGQKRTVYLDNENPFTEGTARFAETERKSFKAFAEWIPRIPEEGEYAVYISYQTVPESITDAKYMVYHKGGITEFRVNQQIGGGTWVYLGTFHFDKGSNENGMVVLSNESKQKGVVCADAVRFGGGMGNIARGKKGDDTAETSGLPRYLEAARYSAQWAGMPYSVYGSKEGENDYADDIIARSAMTNYLSGGSVYNPSEKGLGVPFVMTMGIHSDAGYDKDDKIIGSLGIYTTNFNEEKLNNGMSRYASRDLTDIVLTGLHRDINSSFSIDWTRRSMWDRNYGETRMPAVPSMILEILSHQNFADMQMGHDPKFKFVVSRSIYKSILRFVSSQHGMDYVVQPLPVSHFAVEIARRNTVELSWQPVEDPLEPTATPQEYIVYTRLGYGAFDNGVLVRGTSHRIDLEPGLVYSFKVTAVNKGGESFPSEILAAYIAPNSKGTVMIVNGFDRISGPAVINTSRKAGFDLEKDPGVPYLYNTSFCGIQTGFDRKKSGKETKGGWGFSGNDMEGRKIAGNTFDYPFIHGKAIQSAGNYSFVSCSDEAVESGYIKLYNYPVVDYILGLEKQQTQEKYSKIHYKAFTPVMQKLIQEYCMAGGNILISGSYVGSDMVNTPEERSFIREILKYDFAGSIDDSYSGQIYGAGRTFTIPRSINRRSYAVTAPESIIPLDSAFPAFAYTDGNRSAGIAYKGTYSTFVLGFPFESIMSEMDRAHVMAGILGFFEKE